MADAGVIILVLTVLAILAGAVGAYLVNAKYHPAGEELRIRNRPPNAR